MKWTAGLAQANLSNYPMQLVVYFLIIKTHFCLKRCSSLLKGRKAVLGNSDFCWCTYRQTQQSDLNLAISLLLSQEFGDEDNQWEREMAEMWHISKGTAEQRHIPHSGTPNHQNPEPCHNRCDMNTLWSEVGQCCSGSSQLFLSREMWGSGPSAEPLLGKQAVNFLQIVQASSNCQIQSLTRRFFPMLSLSETNFLYNWIGWWWAGYKIWESIRWASLVWLVTKFPLIQCQNQENLRTNAARNITRNNISRRKIDLLLLIKIEHRQKRSIAALFPKRAPKTADPFAFNDFIFLVLWDFQTYWQTKLV